MQGMSEPRQAFSWRSATPILGIVAAAALGLVLLRDTLSFEALRDNREALLAWRDANFAHAVAAYAMTYVAVVSCSLPGGTVMTLAGGFLFGLALGTGLTVVAATAGATLLFLAARAGFGDVLRRRLEAADGQGLLARIDKGLRENEVSYLLILRLVPAVPFFVANLAPAFLGARLRVFVLTTFVGIIPGTAVYTWIGSGLGAVFARGETPDLGIIFDPVVLGPLLALAALAGAPIVLRRLRGRAAS